MMAVADRALRVDDELDICKMVSRHLQRLNLEADYSLTLKDARLKVGKCTYEVIFLDLNLTDGTGFEFLQHIKQLKLKSKIIIISAYDNESKKALAMGGDVFVSKPFTVKSINEALRTLNFLAN
jgi:Response regulator containing CheY-like receiver, AAA-type ATPase, and DNA-binding domains